MRAFLFFELYHTLVLAGDSSYISSNVSSPLFSAKNASVTAYLLESSQARFKKCRLLFYNYKVFARVQINNGNKLLLLSLFVSSSVKESQKFIFSRNFPALVTYKTSKICDKRNFIIAADSAAAN